MMFVRCLSTSTVAAVLMLINAQASSEGPPCSTVLKCAQIAADAATRAEAAAVAMRRPAVISHVLNARSFAGVYQNKSGHTMIVIVTAFKDGPANTMFGNVAATSQELPVNGGGGIAANGSTIVGASFINNTYASNITLVVPPDYFYNVTNDGGNIKLTNWMEAAL